MLGVFKALWEDLQQPGQRYLGKNSGTKHQEKDRTAYAEQEPAAQRPSFLRRAIQTAARVPST